MGYQRIIFHIDVNAAFLSWSAVNRLSQGDPLDIRTISSVIGGNEQARKGIVLAKSEPARQFHIVTGETLVSARQKCPSLAVFPPEYSLYMEFSNRMYQILCEYSPVIERYSIDECFLDYTGMQAICGDPVQCADAIRRRIFAELGFTVNIGVGTNKLLAKMAGELRRPDATNTLFPWELQKKFWPLPVRDLFMVGRATEAALKRRGIYTIGQLAAADRDFLYRHLKKQGLLVWGYANGLDTAPVVPNHTIPPKSFSNSATLPADVSSREDAHFALLPLCESTASRMRREGFACRLVSVQIKYGDFTAASRQKALVCSADATDLLIHTVCSLFDRLWNGKPIRLLGVRLASLTESTCRQLSLFEEESFRHYALDAAADDIRQRYGRRALVRASALHHDFSHLDRYDREDKPRVNCPF